MSLLVSQLPVLYQQIAYPGATSMRWSPPSPVGVVCLRVSYLASWDRGVGANSLSDNGGAVVPRRNSGDAAISVETTGCFEADLEVFSVAALAVDVKAPPPLAAMGRLKSLSTDRRKLLLSEVLTEAVGRSGLAVPRWGVPGSVMANAE